MIPEAEEEGTGEAAKGEGEKEAGEVEETGEGAEMVVEVEGERVNTHCRTCMFHLRTHLATPNRRPL